MPGWLLQSIDLSGGFLDGVHLELPPGLTCVIGPRGSGKSTLTEAIRYGIGGLTGASKSRSDLVQANLGSAVLTLRASVSGTDSVFYTIRRTYRQPASLLGGDGASISSVDLDRGTFLPLDGFSSTEIEAIADESLGERRRTLLDELRADDLRIIELRLSDLRRSLEANSDRVKAARRHVGDLTEQIEEIGDVRARLKALPEPSVDGTATRLRQTARQKMLNERELVQLDDVCQRLNRYQRDLTALVESYGRDQFSAIAVIGSENTPIGDEADQILTACITTVSKASSYAMDALSRCQTDLKQIRERLLSAHKAQEAEHQRLQAENLAASRAVQERAQAEEAVARLERLEAERLEVEKGLTKLLNQRQEIKAELLLERERVSEFREQTAAELQSKAVTNVRIRVLRHADDLAYQQVLIEGLKGAGLRNHEDILTSLQNLRPEQLAQIIQYSDVEELEAQTSLGIERCRKILGAFRTKIDHLVLEVLPTDDRICIELNVGTTTEPLFKDASDLSRGQKCTALLPLLLARRDIPLIIDQPEDNLDNHFIYETVVETIRQMKGIRQMVFITHNANIPVLGEADFVVVMNSDGKRGFVEKAGSLDECQDEIVNLLEGGRDAFERRRQRYARS